MNTIAKYASDYSSEGTDLIRATCLHVATVLGDLLDDVVVVGGLVPTLLIDQAQLPSGSNRHVGTIDLDIGLSIGLLTERRYSEIALRLRISG
jgi:hypothetical protein